MRKPRITYANVVSTMALCIALGGVSYAAVKLPKNSVVSATIKNGQVKNADLGKNAVTSAKIKDGTVANADLGSGIDGAKLGDGSVANGKLAGGIDGGKLADGSVGAGKLAAGVTTPADGSITSAKIADGTVGFGDLSGDLQARAEARTRRSTASGRTSPGSVHKNVLSVARCRRWSGQYCLTRSTGPRRAGRRAQRHPGDRLCTRDPTSKGRRRLQPSAPNNGVSVQLKPRYARPPIRRTPTAGSPS